MINAAPNHANPPTNSPHERAATASAQAPRRRIIPQDALSGLASRLTLNKACKDPTPTAGEW
jgi:hypothetical protein